MLWGPAEGSPGTPEVADGLPVTAILGSVIICYHIWISPRFRELITTLSGAEAALRWKGGWAGTRAAPCI